MFREKSNEPIERVSTASPQRAGTNLPRAAVRRQPDNWLISLQRTLGNRAASQAVSSAIEHPHDHDAADQPAIVAGVTGTAWTQQALSDAPIQRKAMPLQGLLAPSPAHGFARAAPRTPHGGVPLPQEIGTKMGDAFGVDLSPVRIHEGVEASALGAQAYTSGTKIHFAPGHYRPDTIRGKALLGHELAHVVQQAQGRVPGAHRPYGARVAEDPGLESEADDWGNKAARGERVDVRGGADLAHAESAASIQCKNEGADAIDFRSQKFSMQDFQPSTKLGRFDVSYTPFSGVLHITVRCRFLFVDGERSRVDVQSGQATQVRENVRWTDEKKAAWKRSYMEKVSAQWSNKHIFWCRKPGYERLQAVPVINFVEVDGIETKPAFDIQVFPETMRSHVGSGFDRGVVKLDMGDIQGIGASHEAGHMFGLGDEYYEKGESDVVSHGELAKQELGLDLKRRDGDNVSLMASGTQVLPQHGLTFLEALRAVTKIPEWYMPMTTLKPE